MPNEKNSRTPKSPFELKFARASGIALRACSPRERRRSSANIELSRARAHRGHVRGPRQQACRRAHPSSSIAMEFSSHRDGPRRPTPTKRKFNGRAPRAPAIGAGKGLGENVLEKAKVAICAPANLRKKIRAHAETAPLRAPRVRPHPSLPHRAAQGGTHGTGSSPRGMRRRKRRRRTSARAATGT